MTSSAMYNLLLNPVLEFVLGALSMVSTFVLRFFNLVFYFLNTLWIVF